MEFSLEKIAVMTQEELEQFLHDTDDLELDTGGTSPQYDFKTRVRPFDNVIVEDISGIPAEEFVKINLPNKIGDTL